jgi:hypothetical protein
MYVANYLIVSADDVHEAISIAERYVEDNILTESNSVNTWWKIDYVIQKDRRFRI